MQKTEIQTPAPIDAIAPGPGITNEELRAAIRAGEQLRAETMHRAIVSGFRFLWQVPSRLFTAGTHRHA
jgi:hypothetical protein